MSGICDSLRQTDRLSATDTVEIEAGTMDGGGSEQAGATDRVVIVGAACRFPGSDSLDAYWQNLLTGRNCLTTAERWQQASVDTQGVVGGLLDDISLFDAGFFRISPKEARCMDPQQRLLMEVVHHAIEDAGLPLERLRQLNCGVICTSLPGDYKFLFSQDRELAFSSQSFIGNAMASLSGRISYFYDLNGPSITLDTACSSSLTALQVACLQLQSGACKAAVVGAVSAFATSELFEFAKRAGMLSAKGRCAAFGEEADGFVPSEGVAAILLMTESCAEALGLEVLATIEAFALNHNGQSNGLMAPNSRAQGELIASTYRRFNIPVSRIGYVEAHGTGTQLGDPIELAGLVKAYRTLDPDYTAYLGASKSVIGHALVCSGLASLLKTMLVLRHEVIPPHPILGKTGEQIDLGSFILNAQKTDWPTGKDFAAVSAFGFTGSNGHIVLRKTAPRATVDFNQDGAYPFLFSAQTAASLYAKLTQFLHFVEDLPQSRLGSLSVALGKGVEYYRLRVVVAASTCDQLVSALRDLMAQTAEDLGTAPPNLHGITDEGLVARVLAWVGGADVPLYDNEVVACAPRLDLPKYPFDRKSYWVGAFAPGPSEPSTPTVSGPSNVLAQLKTNLADLLGFSERDIDVTLPLRDYGVDSISVLQLLAQFDGGAGLQPQDIFNYVSLEAFANDLARRMSAETVHNARSGVATTAVVRERRRLLQWQKPGQSGQPILLLPPLNMSVNAWSQQIPALIQQGYAPHIAIYPGHDGNPMPAAPVDMQSIVDEIVDYISEDLGADSVPMFGWSLGGCFSLAIAAQAPLRVASLVVISAAARFGDEVFSNTVELHNELEANADYLDIVLKPKRSVVEQVSAGATLDVLSQYYRMLGDFDMTAELPSISVKMLIVHGHRDAVIDNNDVALLRLIPDARIVEFADNGHFIPLLAARRFNDVALRFLSSERVL